LREVISAGEQLLITPQVRAFFKRLPNCVLHNQYGPTETHVVTSFSLKGAAENWPERPAIGTPISNARVAVVDENGALCPIGLSGEIEISGVPVARGYWNEAELSRDKFGNEQKYRSGDLARWRHDGQLEFLGRADAQLKVRGFRVEPGEIENALLNHPALAEVAVAAETAANADSGEARLIAYFVVAPETSAPEADELRKFLREVLPEYMIPASFVALAKLPRTASGKVDRRSLKDAPRASYLPSVSSMTFGSFEEGKL
jgi:acyl-coenzyme A synthetase/AMP-(fatty) acid ligase